MSGNPFYIVDVPLPLSQDFDSLKSEGLALVQAYSGTQWSNLNPSDPGVTILDQVCYAFTELGYCIDFSMADLLTGQDGKIRFRDQFYLPEEILSTAPVTVQDYRKYVIDGVDGVDNLVLLPVTQNVTGSAYRAYLLINSAITTDLDIANVCLATFFCLNKSRNLGEFFLFPQALKQKTHLLSGTIELEKETDLNNVLNLVQAAIRNYIFPQVSQRGYVGLGGPGENVDEVFDGPYLTNGWIATDDLGEKKDRLRTIEISQIVEAIPGVSSVSALNFDAVKPTVSEIKCQPDEILVIDLMQSIQKGLLQVYCMGRNIGENAQLRSMMVQAGKPHAPDNDLLYGAKADIHASLPHGKYRDINSYYSIQNTFPEIFAVGANSIVSNNNPYQVAQSRQLKGYLTLFDQVLANQFSQLANLDRLFSFKNSMSGTPSDVQTYYAIKDPSQKAHPLYPVPYKVFSPTYFYQSLYDVPYIKPLLKDNDVFKISMEPESEKEQEIKSWTAYKQDPYNAYIHGLMQLMEDDQTGLTRRNQILDHLLARHGESPLVINATIDGSKYSGDSLKDQVIFKSLYLQNLGLLSYYRQKAYNYEGAKKIADTIVPVPKEYERALDGGDFIDFIFNSEKIDRLERLTAADFINYSGMELKLGLLLGLKTQYQDFIVNNTDDPTQAENINLAFWMIAQRRGMIFFETGLLYNDPVNGDGNAGQNPFTDLVLFLPNFIPQFNTAAFNNRLTNFLDNTLPVQLSYTCSFIGPEQLQQLIPAFANWHNNLIYQSHEQIPSNNHPAAETAAALIAVMNQIIQNP